MKHLTLSNRSRSDPFDLGVRRPPHYFPRRDVRAIRNRGTRRPSRAPLFTPCALRRRRLPNGLHMFRLAAGAHFFIRGRVRRAS
ncbi:hypothetical protein EVAR_14705_1 [Eumeta japonica]|uniref:Uncharacterized protein n=1 Tax=Eumeta variegata TaxID=151549 RepID=A0A4C1U3Q2_EUMVA|nr:hypothetical protein EVAR_14705_1 [Eumeta japonica]